MPKPCRTAPLRLYHYACNTTSVRADRPHAWQELNPRPTRWPCATAKYAHHVDTPRSSCEGFPPFQVQKKPQTYRHTMEAHPLRAMYPTLHVVTHTVPSRRGRY